LLRRSRKAKIGQITAARVSGGRHRRQAAPAAAPATAAPGPLASLVSVARSASPGDEMRGQRGDLVYRRADPLPALDRIM